MTNTATAVNNGVNVEALLGAREALTEAPEAAKFVWRAESEWKSGTHTESRIEKFFGLGEEQSHTRQFSYDTDHPEIFAAEDNGSTPVEFVLVGCSPQDTDAKRLTEHQHVAVMSGYHHQHVAALCAQHYQHVVARLIMLL